MKRKYQIKEKFQKILYLSANILITHRLRRATYLDAFETIEYLKKTNKSVIRWGDGETLIANDIGIYFQSPRNELKHILIQILKGYSINESKYLIAVPSQYLSMSTYSLLKEGKLSVWWRSQLLLQKFSRKDSVFGDAFVFRPLSKVSSDLISSLWDGCSVILIHSSEGVYRDFSKRYPESKAIHIKINDRNAFDQYRKTMEEVKNAANESMSLKEDLRILVSAGPTAKAIIYELSLEGYICYDMGQYFKWKFYGESNQKGI